MLYDRQSIEAAMADAEVDNFSHYLDLKDDQEEYIRIYGEFSEYDYYDGNFNVWAHQIVEFNQTSPKSLLELSIKAVKRYDIKTEDGDIPKSLQKKMQVGLYTPGDDPPDMISERGKALFRSLGKIYIDIFKDPDLVFLCAARNLGEMFYNVYFYENPGEMLLRDKMERSIEEEMQGLVNIYENLFAE